jgi:hypothetical protein
VLPASKLKKGDWRGCTLRVTMTALERLAPSGAVKWRIRFCDLRQLAIIVLDPLWVYRHAKGQWSVAYTPDQDRSVKTITYRTHYLILLS